MRGSLSLESLLLLLFLLAAQALVLSSSSIAIQASKSAHSSAQALISSEAFAQYADLLSLSPATSSDFPALAQGTPAPKTIPSSSPTEVKTNGKEPI